MTTVVALSSDLSSLISESKRRNSEIKHATEYSLNILKKFDPTRQSEPDFFKQLTQEPNFITPFILSCQSRNVKFSTIAIHGLQRLISVHGLPFSSLENILDSLIEASHLPLEIQLKVLQLLPTIYQAYGASMNGKLISKLLFVCAVLQGPSKPPVVVNTAAATLQQLVIFIFDKVNDEDKLDESDVMKTNTVNVDNNKQVEVSDNVYDCYRIFDDLCSLIEHHKPTFLQFNYLTETFLLELIESILNNFTSIFIKHNELGYLLRFRITPILLRSLSIPAKEFSVVVRIARIIYLLIKKNLQILKIECEIVISLLNHMILNDLESPIWKKVLVLEIFNGLFHDFSLVEAIFKEYDYNNDRKHVLNDFFINSFCLINSPNSKKLIKFRTVLHPPVTTTPAKPLGSALGMASVNDKSYSVLNLNSASSSNTLSLNVTQQQEFIIDNSLEKLSYMEMLDKTESPPVPENYVYYLILSCCTNFVEGIGKYVMELSMTPQGENPQTEGTKQFKFLNKLNEIESSTLKAGILLSQAIIEKNHKVLLSTFEVFLYSKLSNESFHSLIRSLQKLCYSSGILGLNLPRDDIIMLFAISSINNTDASYGYNNGSLFSNRASIDSRRNSAYSADSRRNSAYDTHTSKSSRIDPVHEPGTDKNKDVAKLPKESKSFGESLFGSISSRFSTHANNINQNLSSLATSITNSTTNLTSPALTSGTSNGQLVLHSRYINSRHLITLRALINLGISLGSTLGANWKNILVTLQWMNYYVHGPPENFDRKFVYHETKYGTLPVVKQNEIVVIQNSVKKLFDSLKDYSLSSFLVVLRNLTNLSDASIALEKNKDDEKKLYDAIAASVFDSFLSSLEESGHDKEKFEFSPLSEVSLSVCYYNRQYFLDLLGTLSKLNSPRFLIECVEDKEADLLIHDDSQTDSITGIKVVLDYLMQLATNRSFPNHCRVKSANIFNNVLKNISKEGFTNNNLEELLSKKSSTDNETEPARTIEFKLLNSLLELLELIESLQSDDNHEDKEFSKLESVLVVNCEFEIISKSLENLRELLDMFGIYFHKDSWLLVFKIIDLTFEFFNHSAEDAEAKNASYGFVEKKSVLTKLSFEILQLILSDFLNILPLKVVRILINTTFKFADQAYDINISFSAISYFWQISDYVRDLLANNIKKENYAKGNELLVDRIQTREDLVNYVEHDFEDANKLNSEEDLFVAYSCLWIYLLRVLVNISNNQKDQVRNGSIQTFFRIIDSHGKHLSSWDLCYNIVISSLFSIRPKILRNLSWEELAQIKEAWSETLILIINGVVRFYGNYFCDFDQLELKLALKYWGGLITYFEDILKLSWNNCDLKLYEAFNDLLDSFVTKKLEDGEKIPEEIVQFLFNFWAKKNVSYNVSLNKHYQESLTSSMKAFVPLIKIIGEQEITQEIINDSLKLFNSAVRYPILPTYFNDNVYPTDLQKSVLDNLKLVVYSQDPQIQSNVILQLIANVVLPFSTRSKIKEQLLKTRLPKDTKVSTFVALSYYSVSILETQINNVTDFKALVQNKCTIKLISSLLEPIKQNAKGINHKKVNIASSKEAVPLKELWIKCVDIILYVLTNTIVLVATDNIKNEIDSEIKEQLWYLVIELYRTTLSVNSNNFEHEGFNVQTLKTLKQLIIPYISLKSFPESLLDNFANYILESSYLYEKDEIEISLLEEDEEVTGNNGNDGLSAKSPAIHNPQAIAEKFANFDFDNHIPLVKPLRFIPKYKINLICLNDLIELSKIPDENGVNLINDSENGDNPGDNITVIKLKSQLLISEKIFPFLIIRVLYILRKFIANESLTNSMPLPKIRKLEMVLVLKGLNDLLENFNQSAAHEKAKKYQELATLIPLVIKSVHVASDVRGISWLIESFFYEYNENLRLLNARNDT